jgi:hypothetical protein
MIPIRNDGADGLLIIYHSSNHFKKVCKHRSASADFHKQSIKTNPIGHHFSTFATLRYINYILSVFVFVCVYIRKLWSRDSPVGIQTGYELDDRAARVRDPIGSIIFFSPHCPDRLWGPPSLLSNG